MSPAEYEFREISAAVGLRDDIERAFISKHGGLATWLLSHARVEAAQAMRALIDIAPTDIDAIRSLQNDVQRHRDLIDWMQQAVEKGREAWEKMSRAEQEAMVGALGLDDA